MLRVRGLVDGLRRADIRNISISNRYRNSLILVGDNTHYRLILKLVFDFL